MLIWFVIPPKYHYEEGLKKKPEIEKRAMVVCNHNNYSIDGFLMYLIWFQRNIFPLVTKVFFDRKKSLWAWYTRNVGAIRIGPDVDNLASPFEKVKDYFELERVICAMPEGGVNTTGGKMLPFKSGLFLMAFNANAPIYPTYIGRLKLFKRTHIYVGNPITPEIAKEESERTGEKPVDAFMQLTRKTMDKFENEYFDLIEKIKTKK
ncbi:MAG: 1-acyl-sn-glycerol-3-phosphate acyltransferase [Firmicutes bacterium]|nr:1-acyl-sn-glycerol-3-phosphate acyltransferase [Bacillota bacterium]